MRITKENWDILFDKDIIMVEICQKYCDKYDFVCNLRFYGGWKQKSGSIFRTDHCHYGMINYHLLFLAKIVVEISQEINNDM